MQEFKMKYLIPILIALSSCISHNTGEETKEIFPQSLEQVEIKYARGLEINYHKEYTSLVSKSLEGNEFYRDSLVLIHSDNNEIETSKSLRQIPLSINCQSSTHLAYLDFFERIDVVSGLCGMEFVQEGKIKEALSDAKTKEVCLGENIQLEAVLETNPDLFLVYPFASSQVKTLEDSGIKTFMIAEYLETDPLARLEWIKLFGALLNREKEANDYFETVENEYNSLTQPAPDTNKNFIFNLPYGESWFTPSANSLIVKLFEDAGMYYFYQEETGTENTIHSQEQVWSDGTKAAYWVIIADRPYDFTLEDLKEENPVYTTFKSVKHEQVIFCNTRTSAYFLQGVIEPQIILKDILYATHKIDQHQAKYFQLLK